MKKRSTALPTNWINGMKINGSHFENSELALFDAMHQINSVHIKDYNYGLFAKFGASTEAFEIQVTKSVSDSFNIELSRCFGTTFSGLRIDVSPETSLPLSYSSKYNAFAERSGQSKNLYLILSVEYANRHATGSPNPAEFPLRHPFALPEFNLDLVEESKIEEFDVLLDSLILAKFEVKGNDIVQDKDYIPPCQTIQSFPLLRSYYNSISESINVIQIATYNLVYKVINKNQNTPLAYNLKHVCEKIIYYVSSLNFQFRNHLYQTSPIETVNAIVQFANHLKLAIDFLPEKEKEDILLYYKEWSDIAPGKFEELLNSIIDIEYSHTNIADSIETVSDFTKIIADLFKKLSELELIGKRRGDKDMVVREINPKQSKKFKMLD